MTLTDLGACAHVERPDRLIEFRKQGNIFHALCPGCAAPMRWENWPQLHEPLRARCAACRRSLPSTELNLEPAHG